MSSRLHWKAKWPQILRPGAVLRRQVRDHCVRALRVDPIPRDTRLFVWHRDGGRCRNCGSDRELQFDHIIPRALGGSNVADNIELLCRTCNLRKGATLFAPLCDPR